MKGYLRNIYKLADSVDTARTRTAFGLWCEKAEESAIQCLKQMAKTIHKRIEGLLAACSLSALLASRVGPRNPEGLLGWDEQTRTSEAKGATGKTSVYSHSG